MRVSVLFILGLMALVLRPITAGGAGRSIEECEDGETCEAEYVVYPTTGWQVNANTTNGRSVEPMSCDPCISCSAYVTWAYSGPNCFIVTYPGGSGFGCTMGGGSFTAYTPCDGDSAKHQFTEIGVGTFTGMLFCPCHH